MFPSDSEQSLAVPAYERVRRRIRDDILSGRLQAGTVLTIGQVAQQYGVSNMPVREAFQRLAGEGLLLIGPYRRTEVRKVDVEFISNAYDLRGAVEGLLARKSVPNLTDDLILKLQSVHSQLEDASEANDIDAMLELNQKFHSLIYRAAGNPQAFEVYERSVELVMTLRRKHGYSEERRRRVAEEHTQILEALRARDAEAVAAAVQQHCEGAKEDLVHRMKSLEGQEVVV